MLLEFRGKINVRDVNSVIVSVWRLSESKEKNEFM